MSSVSSKSTFSKGVRYNLPRSFYRLKIGGGGENNALVAVSHEVQADDISFSIDVRRNPAVKRVQNYALDGKGMLTTAKTDDVGQIPEILEYTARSVVAISQPGTSFSRQEKDASRALTLRPKNQLSPDEYDHFMGLFKKMNFEISRPAGSVYHGRIPGTGGEFVLHFTPPDSGRGMANEKEIRKSLREAAGKVSPAAGKEGDETLLAAGVIARSASSGNMKYTIFVSKDAINEYRRSFSDTREEDAQAATKALARKQKAQDKLDKVEAERSRINDEIKELEKDETKLKEDKSEMERLMEELNLHPANARTELPKFNKRELKFVKDDAYWAAYNAAMLAALEAGESPEKAQVFRGKLLLLGSHIEKLTSAAISQAAESKKVKQTAYDGGLLDSLNAEKDDAFQNERASNKKLKSSEANTQEASIDIPIIVANEQMPVVDERKVQLIPLWRNLVGASSGNITMQNGVVTGHEITEESEILGVVKIPLTVVGAVLQTTQNLWTSKEASIKKETDYINAQAALIEAKAKLKEAENAEPTP